MMNEFVLDLTPFLDDRLEFRTIADLHGKNRIAVVHNIYGSKDIDIDIHTAVVLT